MKCLNKSHSKLQYLSVTCLSHFLVGIPEERLRDSSDRSSLALWEAQEGFAFSCHFGLSK